MISEPEQLCIKRRSRNGLQSLLLAIWRVRREGTVWR